MNQSYQITINDSALSTKRWGLHAAFLFMGCYAVEFLAYCLIDHIFGIYNCYVEEYMPEGFALKEMQTEYKKAAMLHDVIVPRVAREDGRLTVALTDAGGRPYAVVVFQEKQ